MKSAAEIFVYSLIYYFQGFKRSRAELRRTSYAGEANTAEPPPGQQLMIVMMMIMIDDNDDDNNDYDGDDDDDDDNILSYYPILLSTMA